jgi:hypothetical protein
MLGAPAEHLVVKQSRTVNVLLREVLLASGEDERSAAEALLSLLLPLFSRADAETPRWLFFKPSSWAVNLIQPLDRLFPATPAVFLYRDPHQAVASMLASPPAHPPYVFPSEVPPATLHRFFPSLAAGPPVLDAVSYYAHVWRSAAEAALDTLAESLHVVDYAALVADPEDVLAGILSHFTIPCRSATIQTMRHTLRVYSKDRDGRAAFDPDGTHHRTPLDPAQRRQVDAVVGDLPAYLTSRRR